MTGTLNISKLLHKMVTPSIVAYHVILPVTTSNGSHFEILASGKSDLQCKIKEILLTSDLKHSLNENVGSEELFLYQFIPEELTTGSIRYFS